MEERDDTRSRLTIIILFTVCGGAIGGMLLALAFALIETANGPALPWLVAIGAGWGALWGVVPAVLTGVTYAFLPSAMQRIILAPFIGGAISAVVGIFQPFADQGSIFYLPFIAWYSAAGAGAALVCAAIARRFRIDATGRVADSSN